MSERVPFPPPRPTGAPPRRGSELDALPLNGSILVVRPGRYGDMIVATPSLRLLRETRPDAHIALLTTPDAEPLLERLDSIDELIAEQPADWMLGPEAGRRSARLFAKLKRRHFDLGIQLKGGGDTMNAVLLATSPSRTVGQAYPFAPKLDQPMPYARIQPEVLRLIDIVCLAGAPFRLPPLEVPLTTSDHAEVAALPAPVTDALDAGRLIVVHAGASSGARRWPPERFAAVIERLARSDRALRFALTGTADERPIVAAVIRHLGARTTRCAYDVAGRLSFGGLAALIATARLVITNDSAPSHIASALDVPAVVIFGNGHPGVWAPLMRARQRAVAAETTPCRSFAACGCRDDDTAICLRAVAVEPVVREAELLLRMPSDARETEWRTRREASEMLREPTRLGYNAARAP